MIDGDLWAIDHMRLAYEPTLVAAKDDAERRLRGPLEQLARRYDCSLAISVLPPRHATASRSAIDAYYANIKQQAEDAIVTGDDWSDTDGFTSVHVTARTDDPNVGVVDIRTWLSSTASIEEQVAAAVGPPLVAKLGGQLVDAKRAGRRVMLLVDQVKDPTVRQPAQFLPSWPTVKLVVGRIVASSPGVIDCVWFRDPTARSSASPSIRTTDPARRHVHDASCLHPARTN